MWFLWLPTSCWVDLHKLSQCQKKTTPTLWREQTNLRNNKFPSKTQETPTFQEIALFETSIAPKWLPMTTGILDIHPWKSNGWKPEKSPVLIKGKKSSKISFHFWGFHVVNSQGVEISLSLLRPRSDHSSPIKKTDGTRPYRGIAPQPM